jgi:hypothetical protein
MTHRISAVLLFAVVAFLIVSHSLPLFAQHPNSAYAVVPTLVNFTGVLTASTGKPLTNITGVTFSLYAEQAGGAPLWLETQNVQPDVTGHYSIMLGSTSSQGMPANWFATGQARWLEVQPQGQDPQPRVMLLSVPYALKAEDAQTLGGKPASSFMLAPAGVQPAASAPSPNANITGSGAADFLPLFTAATTIGNSRVYQNSSGNIGIATITPAATLDVKGKADVRDTLTLFPKSADAALTLNGTAFQLSSAGVMTFVTGQTFPGTGTITGITAGTDLTGGGSSGVVTLNLDTTKVPQLNSANTFTGNQIVNGNLSASGLASSAGFEIGSNLFDYGSYSNGNAFLGFAGNGSASGVGNTGAGLQALNAIAGGSSNTAVGQNALYLNNSGYDNTAVGWEALFVNTSTCCNTATGFEALESNTVSGNAAFGYQALSNNTVAAGNSAFGYQALYSNVGSNTNFSYGADNTAAGYQSLYSNTIANANVALGYQALYSNTGDSYGYGSVNTAVGGSALYSNTLGIENTAVGWNALYSNIGDSSGDGGYNTAVGGGALINNSQGAENTAVGVGALVDNTTGSDLTCMGYFCEAGDGLRNATAIGAHAVVGRSNALVLGGTGKYAVMVGIGTPSPSNILTIGRGAGHPVSDSWETYSSRRWKTNIHTLPNALATVEQLRGVSYDLTDSGKHEVGVIAEEVGKVVPEVVTYEDNGKDARGVDYSRLTALLIEATKEQQALIRKQQAQIRAQQAQLLQLSSQVRAIRASLKTNPRTSPDVRNARSTAAVIQQ